MNGTLAETGGMRNFRRTLAETLGRLQDDKPAVVAIDTVLSDASDPRDDAALEQALAAIPNLILAATLSRDERWEDPLPAFRRHAKAVGHVHAAPDPVSRKLPLEVIAGHDGAGRWRLKRTVCARAAYR